MKTEYSINYNAETIEEAKQYLSYRYKQLGKFGYSVREEIVVENNSIVTLYNDPNKENIWGSVYVLHQYRGNSIFKERVQQFMIAIITLQECNIEDYLRRIKCQHIVLRHSNAYRAIQRIYADDRTERSKVPFIYHIDEGGTILHSIEASEIVKDAYYLHPLLQEDSMFKKYKNDLLFHTIHPESIILAMEYRRVANSYLSTMSKSNFVGLTCSEIRQMLIADKIQNYKDFILYHKNTHPRSKELDQYFKNWFDILEISEEKLNNYIITLHNKVKKELRT